MGRIQVALASLVLFLAACEEQKPGGDDIRSGSRLRARYYVAEDGGRLFVGMWDLELQTYCVAAQASDEQLRCLPTTVAETWGLSASSSGRP